MKPIENGTRFTRLVVVEDLGMREEKNGKSRHYYKCLCDCGNYFEIRGDLLKGKNNQSCGCLQYEHAIVTHGLTGTKVYSVWASMKDRCTNPKSKAYKWYGARGIKVCDEWIESFESFNQWMIENDYQEGLTIDRIDVDGDYEPSNCRLITQQEQLLNTRRSVFYTYNGKTQTIREWADELGIKYMTLYGRLRTMKWDVERAFEESVTTIPKGSTSSIDTVVEAVNS